jgi:hypothetical protein
VAGILEQAGGRRDAERLVAELVGRHEQQAHR